MERLYKWVRPDGSAANGGVGVWPLPTGDKPGRWMPALRGNLVPCEHGYHLCREGDILRWILAPGALYEAEAGGALVVEGDKVVARRARLVRLVGTLDERTARLYACDCAERALPRYERDYPDDARPREAIAVARLRAAGAATDGELVAAGDAARDAAEEAAWDAAGDAARDAAWAAAGAAAWAAGDAAWAAEDAAWDAAGDAAGDAARAAAGDAARGAAGDAARGATRAAWDAAWAAERSWQLARLCAYLRGEVG